MNTPATSTETPPFPICTIAVIGLGLLGGSVAKALRRQHPRANRRLIGCARREETRRLALDSGAFDDVTDNAIEAAREADLVVIATPVDRIACLAIAIASACPQVLITDVGSTKYNIVAAVNEVPIAAARFIAAHPIAGSEKAGIEHSQADLFDGKPIILTPSGNELPGAVAAVHAFWQSTGGRVIQLSPRRHDDLLAITSHTPHLLSALIANQLPDEAISMVGSGWLDTTRIAAGDAGLWTAIVVENRDAILASLQSSAADLANLIEIIRTADNKSLTEFLHQAKQKRTAVSG